MKQIIELHSKAMNQVEMALMAKRRSALSPLGY